MILLETLPGWPTAPEQSALDMLLLTVIGPIAVAVIITAIVLGPKYFADKRSPGANADS